MKKVIVFISVLFFTVTAFAQQYDTTPPYLKTKVIPAFTLLSLDSVSFTEKVLLENKKTIIMLFNPECEHCQDQLQLLLNMPGVIDAINLVLTSSQPLYKLKIFYDKFHLEKYTNVHLGKDYKYFFGGFFQPKTVPVLAFYNQEKKLLYFNQGSVKKKEIIEALKD